MMSGRMLRSAESAARRALPLMAVAVSSFAASNPGGSCCAQPQPVPPSLTSTAVPTVQPSPDPLPEPPDP